MSDYLHKSGRVFRRMAGRGRSLDLVGERFGRLVVIGRAPSRKQASYWVCKCDCGAISTPQQGALLRIRTVSCGCYSHEQSAARLMIDGRTNHPLRETWQQIIYRCTNPNSRSYPSYGGRGISVYKPWRSDCSLFFAWIESNIGPKPSKHHQLDRIDNDGNYEPGNLRWATVSENAKNRRTVRNLAKRVNALEAENKALWYLLSLSARAYVGRAVVRAVRMERNEEALESPR